MYYCILYQNLGLISWQFLHKCPGLSLALGTRWNHGRSLSAEYRTCWHVVVFACLQDKSLWIIDDQRCGFTCLYSDVSCACVCVSATSYRRTELHRALYVCRAHSKVGWWHDDAIDLRRTCQAQWRLRSHTSIRSGETHGCCQWCILVCCKFCRQLIRWYCLELHVYI